MLKHILLFYLVLLTLISVGQVKIGDGGSQAQSTSILELESTTKGLLLPRLNQIQIDAMVIPAKLNHAQGLLIYNVDKKCIQTFDTSGTGSWIDIKTGVSSEWLDASVIGKNGFIYNRRAMENGDTLVISYDARIGIGTTQPFGVLDLSNSNAPLIVPRMTSTERDALTNQTNGSIIYNTTDNQFNFRENGAWKTK